MIHSFQEIILHILLITTLYGHCIVLSILNLTEYLLKIVHEQEVIHD